MMLPKPIVYIFIVIDQHCSLSSIAIPKDVNKLSQILAISKPDNNRVNLHAKICHFANTHSAETPIPIDSTLVLSGRAKLLAQQFGNNQGIGSSYQGMAQALVRNKGQLNQLAIADDGPDVPEGFISGKIDSLGIKLMRNLSS